MLFSAPLFLFIFMPLTAMTYVAAPRPAKNGALLIASLLFYFWGEPVVIFMIAALAVIDYFLVARISRGGPAVVWYLAAGIGGNLAFLFVFKYADFAMRAAEPLAGPLPHLNLVLPLGISFVVFEKITYLVDVYRGVGRPARSLKDYLLFVFFFPKMLAGPIIKYHEIDDALRGRPNSWDDRTAGFLRFLWGLARKVLIADTCGEVADTIFGLPAGAMGFSSAWLGVVAFTVQIYFDFGGYSDMAIGLARMFGFRLRENFDNPYGSASFSEFWRRWHISLSTWIRDYLYFPLGGSRHGAYRTYVNLWTCFLLSGLWHGAGWTFILWGAWNGLFLVCDRIFWNRVSKRLPRLASVAVTLFLIMIGWAIFRAHTFSQLQEVLTAMFMPARSGSFVRIQSYQIAAISLGLIGSLVVSVVPVRQLVREIGANPLGRAAGSVAVAAIGALALAKAVVVTFHPFLYFRF